MIVYSFIQAGSIDGIAGAVLDVAAFDHCDGRACCIKAPAAEGQIVAVETQDANELLLDPAHVGADATDATAFEAWLVSRGVGQPTANSLATAADVAAAMAAHIQGQ